MQQPVEQDVPTAVCNAPYILNGETCCLDENQDNACDTQVVEEEVVCTSPYIHFGEDCCLDANTNGECDSTEVPVCEKTLIGTDCCDDANSNRICDEKEPKEEKFDPDSALDAVVRIDVSDRWETQTFSSEERGWVLEDHQQSGFFISSDGLIMTNAHVVMNYIIYCSLERYEYCSLKATLTDGKEYDLKWVAMSENWDFALVRIAEPDREFSYLKLAAESGNVGDTVYVLGAPLGKISVTQGIISQKDRDSFFMEEKEYSQYLQTDAAINEGTSGGAIISEKGEVVALASYPYLKDLAKGVNFGLQSEALNTLMRNTYTDMSTVVDKTNVFIKHAGQSIAKDIQVLNDGKNSFVVNRASGIANFDFVQFRVTNNRDKELPLCYSLKLMTWSGQVMFKKRINSDETLAAHASKEITIKQTASYDTDINNVYVVEVLDCETDALLARVFGPAVLRMNT